MIGKGIWHHNDLRLPWMENACFLYYLNFPDTLCEIRLFFPCISCLPIIAVNALERRMDGNIFTKIDKKII